MGAPWDAGDISCRVDAGPRSVRKGFSRQELLPSGRVLLHDFAGEHNEKEFEQVR